MRMDALQKIILGVALGVGMGAASTTFAQDTSSLINQALDQPVKMQFDTVLPQAMESIARKTGVRMQADPAVWDMLPWGQQTNITPRSKIRRSGRR